MKRILQLLCFFSILLASCKNDGKDNKTDKTADRPSTSETIPANDADNDDIDADLENLEVDLGELKEAMGGILGGAQDKGSSEQGMYTSDGQLNMEYLKSDAGKPMRKVFAKMAEVTEEEVDLALTLPTINTTCSEKQIGHLIELVDNPKIIAHLNSGKASPGFLEIYNEAKEKAEAFIQKFNLKTDQAKKEFFDQNPSWTGLDKSMANSYMDFRENVVFLPLGDLSFADSVIAFQPGKPEGRTPEKSVGPPESIAPDALLDCAVLGLSGKLTLFFEDNAIIDVNGPDIYVFELGAIEPTNLEISKDGQNWIDVGQISGGTAYVDIGNYIEKGEVFHYVRFTDLQTQSDQPGADIDAVAAIGGALRMNLNSAVLFETGSHILKEEGREAIAELGAKMESIQKAMITIEGHTDDVGDNNSNKTLSQKRAASVTRELKKIITNSEHTWREVGYGENQPIAPNDNEENRAKNRRVEILVTPY